MRDINFTLLSLLGNKYMLLSSIFVFKVFLIPSFSYTNVKFGVPSKFNFICNVSPYQIISGVMAVKFGFGNVFN